MHFVLFFGLILVSNATHRIFVDPYDEISLTKAYITKSDTCKLNTPSSPETPVKHCLEALNGDFVTNSELYCQLNNKLFYFPFKKCFLLGEGTFGEVWKAYQIFQPKEILVPVIIKISYFGEENLRKVFNNEINTYSKITEYNIPNVPKFITSKSNTQIGVLILEYIKNLKDLETFNNYYCPSNKRIQGICSLEYKIFMLFCVMDKIIDTLQQLNEKNIVHFDVKPQNILVRTNEKIDNSTAVFKDYKQWYDVYLIDFGTSTDMSSKEDEFDLEGSVYTLSPELVYGIDLKPNQDTAEFNALKSRSYCIDAYGLDITLLMQLGEICQNTLEHNNLSRDLSLDDSNLINLCKIGLKTLDINKEAEIKHAKLPFPDATADFLHKQRHKMISDYENQLHKLGINKSDNFVYELVKLVIPHLKRQNLGDEIHKPSSCMSWKLYKYVFDKLKNDFISKFGI